MGDLAEFALETAHAAGRVLMQWFRHDLTIETKSNVLDLVTEADRAAEALIVARIRETHPGHAILAEESGQIGEQGTLTWIIDPLDGTTNFARGYPHFCVSLALYSGTTARLGMIYDPLRDETFWAARGAGAWLCAPQCPRERLRVSKGGELALAVLETGFAYDFKTARRNNLQEFVRVLGRVRALRRSGSAALALAYVAAGRLDGFWEFHLGPWDTAAGALLVTEAGGLVVPIEPSSSHPRAWDPWQDSVVAANPELLEALVGALHT